MSNIQTYMPTSDDTTAWKYYDKLPREVQRLLQGAPISICSESALRVFCALDRDFARFAARLARYIDKELALFDHVEFGGRLPHQLAGVTAQPYTTDIPPKRRARARRPFPTI